MKYIFIINPKAGEGEAQSFIKEEISKIPQRDDCEIYITKAANDATRFVREYCEEHKG